MKVIVLRPHQKACIEEIDNDLASYQKLVGGYIEIIAPFSDGVVLVCNEEGKINWLPLNRAIRDEDGNVLDIIAGTAFLWWGTKRVRRTSNENTLGTIPVSRRICYVGWRDNGIPKSLLEGFSGKLQTKCSQCNFRIKLRICETKSQTLCRARKARFRKKFRIKIFEREIPNGCEKKKTARGRNTQTLPPLSVFLTELPHFWSSTISKNIQPIQLSSLYIVITLMGNFGARRRSN